MAQPGPIDPGFQTRLDRIKSGKQAMTNGAFMVGNEVAPGPPVRKRRNRLKEHARDLLLSPVGAVLGVACVIGARVAVLALFAPGGLYPLELEDPLLLIGVDLGLAVLLLLLVMLFFGFAEGLRRITLIAGFVVALVFEPQLIAQAPPGLAALYPDQMIRDAVIPD